MNGLQPESISTLEFSAGRLLCGQIRSYLDKQCFLNEKVSYFEGPGLVSRDFAVKGPASVIAKISRDLDSYFEQMKSEREAT